VAGTTQVHDDMTGKTSSSAENPGRWGWRRVHGVRRVRRERHQRRLCRVQSVWAERLAAKRARGELVQ